MARKLDDHLNCFGNEPDDDEFSSLTQPSEEESLFGEWLRRDPQWTTDRLIDMAE